MERLAAGETILCAEGYLLALCRMGYVAKGLWIPQFILDHPEVLRGLHQQFTHAGTDVSEAFQVSRLLLTGSHNRVISVTISFVVLHQP